MPKPSDFFVGVIDFFAILLPGALLTVLLLSAGEGLLDLVGEPRGTTERWAAFLVAAYVLGHLLQAFGGLFLDPIYDCLYRDWWKLGKNPLRCFGEKWNTRKKTNLTVKAKPRVFPEEGRIRAKGYYTLLKKADELAGDDPKPDNLYHWAETSVRLGSASASTEIQRHSADSKFFRSFSLVLLVGVMVSSIHGEGWVALVAGGLSLLSVWRFVQTRWTTTLLVYEYFVQLRQRAEETTEHVAS